jgi:hypothetical protein
LLNCAVNQHVERRKVFSVLRIVYAGLERNTGSGHVDGGLLIEAVSICRMFGLVHRQLDWADLGSVW